MKSLPHWVPWKFDIDWKRSVFSLHTSNPPGTWRVSSTVLFWGFFGDHLNYLYSIPVDGSTEGKFLFFSNPFPFFVRCILYQGGTCLSCLLAFTNIRKVPILPSMKDFYILMKYITPYWICELKHLLHIDLCRSLITPTRN